MNLDKLIEYLGGLRNLNYDSVRNGIRRIADEALSHSYDELYIEAMGEIDDSRTMYGGRTKLTLGYGYYLPVMSYRLCDNVKCGELLPNARHSKFTYMYDHSGKIRLIMSKIDDTVAVCRHYVGSSVYYLFDTNSEKAVLRDVTAINYDGNGRMSRMMLVSVRDFTLLFEKYRDTGVNMRELMSYELILLSKDAALSNELMIFKNRFELHYRAGKLNEYYALGVSNERVTAIE